ncbi:hypothetical protein ACFLRA_01645 [Bdellovibrionota bacterium]
MRKAIIIGLIFSSSIAWGANDLRRDLRQSPNQDLQKMGFLITEFQNIELCLINKSVNYKKAKKLITSLIHKLPLSKNYYLSINDDFDSYLSEHLLFTQALTAIETLQLKFQPRPYQKKLLLYGPKTKKQVLFSGLQKLREQHILLGEIIESGRWWTRLWIRYGELKREEDRELFQKRYKNKVPKEFFSPKPPIAVKSLMSRRSRDFIENRLTPTLAQLEFLKNKVN